MARPLRIEFPYVIYHVTSHGHACQSVVRRGIYRWLPDRSLVRDLAILQARGVPLFL